MVRTCAQVMHSDIKARNVLLSANRDVAKISDVGVAKFLNEMATQTQSAYVAWTFAYAAPEILMNQKSGAQVPAATRMLLIQAATEHSWAFARLDRRRCR